MFWRETADGKDPCHDQLARRICSGCRLQELTDLAAEIREVLCRLVSRRTAHFSSNLGVVELTLALHTTFDFARDRLIWDTGHQIYPHKLVTGRYDDFNSIRLRGGLMGYPNPAESGYDLFLPAMPAGRELHRRLALGRRPVAAGRRPPCRGGGRRRGL